MKDTVWECWPLPLAHPHFPLAIESLEDHCDHQVLESRGPGSGHVRELALMKPLYLGTWWPFLHDSELLPR